MAVHLRIRPGIRDRFAAGSVGTDCGREYWARSDPAGAVFLLPRHAQKLLGARNHPDGIVPGSLLCLLDPVLRRRQPRPSSQYTLSRHSPADGRDTRSVPTPVRVPHGFIPHAYCVCRVRREPHLGFCYQPLRAERRYSSALEARLMLDVYRAILESLGAKG